MQSVYIHLIVMCTACDDRVKYFFSRMIIIIIICKKSRTQRNNFGRWWNLFFLHPDCIVSNTYNTDYVVNIQQKVFSTPLPPYPESKIVCFDVHRMQILIVHLAIIVGICEYWIWWVRWVYCEIGPLFIFKALALKTYTDTRWRLFYFTRRT